MKNKNLNFALLLLFISTIVGAQTKNFDTYNTNKDNGIDQNEFNEMYKNDYAKYDTNKDGRISDREFYDNTYNSLDKNKDNNLDENEWKTGYDSMYKDYLKSGNYSDTGNKNQKMSKDDFANRFKNSDYYKSYDTNNDRSIDKKELEKQTFKNWDKNRDGILDKNEYDQYRPHYMD